MADPFAETDASKLPALPKQKDVDIQEFHGNDGTKSPQETARDWRVWFLSVQLALSSLASYAEFVKWETLEPQEAAAPGARRRPTP